MIFKRWNLCGMLWFYPSESSPDSELWRAFEVHLLLKNLTYSLNILLMSRFPWYFTLFVFKVLYMCFHTMFTSSIYNLQFPFTIPFTISILIFCHIPHETFMWEQHCSCRFTTAVPIVQCAPWPFAKPPEPLTELSEYSGNIVI